MPIEFVNAAVDCPLFTDDEIEGGPTVSRQYTNAYCDRFDHMLSSEEALDQLFHFGKCVEQPNTLIRYLEEEDRLVRGIHRLASKPWTLRVQETGFDGNHRFASFTERERTLIRQSFDSPFACNDESLAERIFRSGVRELFMVWLYFEEKRFTIMAFQDVAFGIFLKDASLVPWITRELSKESLHCKWSDPKIPGSPV